MALLVYGLSHVTASLDLRERIAFPEDDLVDAMAHLRQSIPDVHELAILSTCNRTELYCHTSLTSAEPLLQYLASYHDINPDLLEQSMYAHWDDAAARHLMRVCAGLDSQVLGEPQILGQVKQTFETARGAQHVGPQLNRLADHSFHVAKQVRSDTDIGRNPISVAFAAVSLAERIFGALDQHQALLIGAGDTIELVARHLRDTGIGRIVIANRTLSHARELAAECKGEAVSLTEVPNHLAQADLVIASTGSPLPVLGKGMVETALSQRKRRPLFMVDIAVPRDIEPQVADLSDVYLYSIEDISAIIDDNLRSRQAAAREAEKIVADGVTRFIKDYRSRDVTETLTRFRERAEDLQEQVIARALKQLRKGEDPEAVMRRLAHDLTNKLLHHPTVGLRRAGAKGEAELIEAARQLLDIQD